MRVPPYAAVQVIPGVRHTRGTPPAVVEMDAATWIALATGALTWSDAEAAGQGPRQRRAGRPLAVPSVGIVHGRNRLSRGPKDHQIVRGYRRR